MCGAEENLSTYSIGKQAGRPKRVQLCPDHAAPVEVILEAAKGRPQVGTQKRRRVATLEEVEAAKAKSRRRG